MRVNRSLLLVILILFLVSTTLAVEVENEIEDAFSEGEEEVSVIVILEDQDLDKPLILGVSSENFEDRQEMVEAVQEEVLGNLDVKDVSDGEQPSELNEDYELELERKFSVVNGFSGDVTEEGLEKLKDDPNVKKIIVNKIFQTSLSTSVPQINANDVWNFSVGGYNITGEGESVCVIDSGIDNDHDAFQDKIKSQYCYCSLNNADGLPCCPDDSNEDSNAEDDNGHGTHVSGIAAGNLSSYPGVAKDAGIVAIKVCNASGSCATADLISGIEWCNNNATKFNISVISISLGDVSENNDYCNGDATASVINTAVSKNISVIVSAGNEGHTAGIASPSCVQNAIPVGAVNSADSISYNRGNILDLVAPGISITAPYHNGATALMSGTSMSAPHVSGAFMLFRQYWRLAYGLTPTPAEIENKFRITGITVDDSTNSGRSYSRIDILGALKPFINYTLTSVVNASIIIVNNSLINITSDVNLTNSLLEWSHSNGSVINYSMTKFNGTNFYFNITSLTEGRDTYQVYGNDSANTFGVSKSRTLIIDNTAPKVNITNPTNNSNFNVGTQPFNSTIMETNTVNFVRFSFDNSTGNGFNLTPTNVSGNWNFNLDLSSLIEGKHILTVFANDSVNNLNDTEFIQFIIDRTSPSVNFSAPFKDRNFTITSSNQTFNATVRDLNSSVDVVLFSFDNSTGTGFNITVTNQSGYWAASYNVSILSEGKHVVTVIANDSVNNYNKSEKVSFTVDNSLPAAIITTIGGKNYSKLSSNQTISATISDLTIRTVLFSFDNASGNGFNVTAVNSSGIWSVSYNFSTLAEGDHILKLFSNDTHNNRNDTETIIFTTDYTSLPLTSVNSGSLTSSAVTVTWSTDEKTNSSIDYGTSKSLGTVSSSSNRVTSHSISLSGLSASTTYYYNVTSCDYAGNCNSSGNYSFTTNAAASSDSGSSSGGGGGGGGGAAPVITSTSTDESEVKETPVLEPDVVTTSNSKEESVEEKVEETSFIEKVYVKEDETTEISVSKENVPVTKIELETDVEKEVEVNIVASDKKPEVVTDDVEELTGVYKYLEISVDNLDNEELKEAILTFKVEQSWLKENNYLEETVVLQTYSEEDQEWQELKTEFFSKEEQEIIYRAYLDHFSYFAITASNEIEKSFLEGIFPTSLNFKTLVLISLAIFVILMLLFLYKIRNY